MSSQVNYRPEGYHTATPYLIVDGAAKAIDFYRQVFGAEERMRVPGQNGKVMHAEITIGDSTIMLTDECPQTNALAPKAAGGSPVFLMLYMEDVDAVTRLAIAAGATVERPVENQFYGDRSGTIVDPFGHRWTIATHIEDVSQEELNKRLAAMSQTS